MKCPQCHSDNPEGMLFCGKCGTKFASCPKCHFINSNGMSFCGKCGAKLSVETPDAKQQSETKLHPEVQPDMLHDKKPQEEQIPSCTHTVSPVTKSPQPPEEKVKTHLSDSIFLLGLNSSSIITCITKYNVIALFPLCLLPLTITSVVFAVQSYRMVRRQDFVNAKKYAQIANILNWCFFSIFIISSIISVYTIYCLFDGL